MSRKLLANNAQASSSLQSTQNGHSSFRLKQTGAQYAQGLQGNQFGQMHGSFMNQPSQPGILTNGNIPPSSLQTHFLHKKENNFQKLNKQSTMLYLHHHPSQVAMGAGNSLQTQLNAGEKPNASFQSNANKSIDHCQQKASAHGASFHQVQPLKELPNGESEIRGATTSDYGVPQHLASTLHMNFNNSKRGAASKMFSKDIMNRKNSQDKLTNSYLNQNACPIPQENVQKNRPQTSHRMATKNNTFQSTLVATVQNSLNCSQANASSITLQQPTKGMVESHDIGNCNKENVGILCNNNGSQMPLGVNTQFQKQVNSIQTIRQVFNDTSSQLKASKSEGLSEVERQCHNVNMNYGADIDEYQRELESQICTSNCLIRHKITPALRSRMVDWMIEVLTNFKCDDQTFFLAVSLMDRFFKLKQEGKEVSDLHIIGVTVMFISSKYEDIYPLKMKMVFEKIAHKKISIDRIKALEMDIMRTISYRVPAPTCLDFLKVYLKQILNIGKCGRSSKDQSKDKKESQEVSDPTQQGCDKVLIEKMSLYLTKMALHDYELSAKKASLQAVGSLYVALKICEQLKKTSLITNEIVTKLVHISKAKEEDIIDVSQRVLYLAQNFEKAFPGLENLKKTHFVNITQLL